MAELLFRLRNVSDDEADEIRLLLEEHSIDYYETHAGRWGISVAAIWLPDGERFDEARRLIDGYQQARQIRVRQEYDQLRQEGVSDSMAKRIGKHPVQFLLLLAALLFVLYVTLSPFLTMGR